MNRQRISVYDYEREAAERLDSMAYDYYASGAQDEITLRDNCAAYDRIAVRYRVLRGVAAPRTECEVLGQRLSWPVLVAPTAFAKLAHPEGERAIAAAAAAHDTVQVVSTLSTTTLKDLADIDGRRWFQLYIFRDRGVTRELIARAEEHGCSAILVTVDAPVLGHRERDAKNGFELPAGMQVANLAQAGKGAVSSAGGSGLLEYFASQIDPALGWSDIEWLRGQTRLPVVVKGIVRGDDAKLAMEHGCAGVVVSNHGGRQLDTSIATIDALPDVVAAIGGRGAVLIDGGVRRGHHVLKALARGADAVMVGRPVLWGLAVDGQAGVAGLLDLLRQELVHVMQLAGAASLSDLTPDLLADAGA